MVAGLSGLVTCLQSNLIGPNLCGLFSNLGVCRLFSFPLIGSLFLARCMLIGWLEVTWWGRGIPPFQGKPKPRSSHLPAPAAPHYYDWEIHRRETWMSFKCGKKCSNLLVMQDMQIIASMIIIHFTAIRMAKIKQKITTKYCKNVGGHKFLCIASLNVDSNRHSRKKSHSALKY